jgi:rhodanese-related sulfurtransferase
VAGAKHLPIHELLDRLDEVATWSKAAAHAGRDATVWVYCGSGFRAAATCSLLERAGIPTVLVDDGFDQAANRGVPVVTEEEPEETHRFGAAVTA